MNNEVKQSAVCEIREAIASLINDEIKEEFVAALMEIVIENTDSAILALELLADHYGDVLMESITEVVNAHPELKHYEPSKEWAIVGLYADVNIDKLIAISELASGKPVMQLL